MSQTGIRTSRMPDVLSATQNLSSDQATPHTAALRTAKKNIPLVCPDEDSVLQMLEWSGWDDSLSWPRWERLVWSVTTLVRTCFTRLHFVPSLQLLACSS